MALFVLPLFALCNAGITLPLDAASLWIAAPAGESGACSFGLLLGKPLGIFLLRCSPCCFASGSFRPKPAIAANSAAMLCGIGFTMSIFTGQLAFSDAALLGQAKSASWRARFVLSAPRFADAAPDDVAAGLARAARDVAAREASDDGAAGLLPARGSRWSALRLRPSWRTGAGGRTEIAQAASQRARSRSARAGQRASAGNDDPPRPDHRRLRRLAAHRLDGQPAATQQILQRLRSASSEVLVTIRPSRPRRTTESAARRPSWCSTSAA